MLYQVPMIEVAVVVALAGVDPEEHFLYLAPYSERREGPETVADYLNGRRRFFPMVVGGVPKMLNRDQILWVRYEKLPTVVDLEMTLVEKLTIIELANGTRIEGMVPIGDRPRESSRISDVLNDATESFVRIDADEDTYFVNKEFIRTVIPR
ncbi:MAG TPA: hypothetical protein VGQ36_00350 [Thermoanaerobaculia bacterium]|jgi:hypothetical protein|nr:hypothetical protein [Thermoanaerobaculia bacterium]